MSLLLDRNIWKFYNTNTCLLLFILQKTVSYASTLKHETLRSSFVLFKTNVLL